MSEEKFQTFQLTAYTIAGYKADDDGESMPIELHMAHNEDTAVRVYRMMHPDVRDVHVSTMGIQYCHLLEKTLLEHDLQVMAPVGEKLEVTRRRIEEIKSQDGVLKEEKQMAKGATA